MLSLHLRDLNLYWWQGFHCANSSVQWVAHLAHTEQQDNILRRVFISEMTDTASADRIWLLTSFWWTRSINKVNSDRIYSYTDYLYFCKLLILCFMWMWNRMQLNCVYYMKQGTAVAQSVWHLRYWLGDRGQIPVRGWEFFSLPPRPEHLWGPPSLPSDGYRGVLPRRQSGCGVKITTHLHLVHRLRMRGAIPPIPHTFSWRGT
jgi:hypothetical protein